MGEKIGRKGARKRLRKTKRKNIYEFTRRGEGTWQKWRRGEDGRRNGGEE